MKENNKGFTLIELLITLMIVAIVSVAVFSFAVVSSRTYQKQTKDVELQYEAQLAMNQIQELLLDAGEGVSYSYNGVNAGTPNIIHANMIKSDADIPVTVPPAPPITVATKELAICNEDTCYVIQWDAGEQKLYYYEFWNDAGTLKMAADHVLMADYVQSFSANLNDVAENGSVYLDIVFNRDSNYQLQQSVRIRNKVKVNEALSVYYHP